MPASNTLDRPAAPFSPLRSNPGDDRDPASVAVCLVYAQPKHRAQFLPHEQIRTHLSGRFEGNLRLSVQEIHESVQCGEAVHDGWQRLLAQSDIIIVLLTADFLGSELGKVTEEFLSLKLPGRRQSTTRIGIAPVGIGTEDGDHDTSRVRKFVPVKARDCGLAETVWGELKLLPVDGRPLFRHPKLDEVLVQIRTAVKDLAAEIVEIRRQREAPNLTSFPAVYEEETEPTSISECLSQIERELHRLPRLRSTENQRHEIWLRLVNFVDRQNPDKNIEAQLRARSRAQVAEHRRHIPGLEEPALLLPDDPLGFVLNMLSQEEAARWLYLGAVNVRPVLKFPRWHGNEENLVKRLEAYSIPQEWRLWTEHCSYLFEQECPSLLASVSRQDPPPKEELIDAVTLLKEFRSSEPFTVNLSRDYSQIRYVGLLTGLGAQALFRGELLLAETAYRTACQRAKSEGNELMEWVAVRGLYAALRCQAQQDGRSSQAKSDEERRSATRCAELERTPVVAKFREELLVARSSTYADFVEGLQLKLDQEREVHRYGNTAGRLYIALSDQEELGNTPMICGEAATLIGKTCLLLNDTSNLRYAVSLLCRYGSKEDGNAAFYSAGLNASHPEWTDICRDVLHGARTDGERLARLEFWTRHLTEIPPGLLPDALDFYAKMLDRYLPQAGSLIPRTNGDSFSVTNSEFVLEKILDQSIFLAVRTDTIVERLLQLLGHPGSLCWQLVLSKIYTLAWDRLAALGALKPEAMTKLLLRMLELLTSVEGQELCLGTGHERPVGLWTRSIPYGIQSVLRVSERVPVAPEIVAQLHAQLCLLLKAEMTRNRRPFTQTFFDAEIIRWLQSRQDTATRQLIDQQLDNVLTRIEQDFSTQKYTENWGLLGENSSFLTQAQWLRLESLINKEREWLFSKIKTSHSPRPLLWLAAALINQDELPPLRQFGLELLQAGINQNDGLVAAVAAKPDRIGTTLQTLEQVILTCLQEVKDPNVYQHGLDALHNFIYFHSQASAQVDWQRWLSPAFTHIYSHNPQTAKSALRLLDLALMRIPEQVDLPAVLQALCWMLVHGRGRARDEALYVVAHHRARFELVDKARLTKALAAFAPPPTLSVEWCLLQASIPVARS